MADITQDPVAFFTDLRNKPQGQPGQKDPSISDPSISSPMMDTAVGGEFDSVTDTATPNPAPTPEDTPEEKVHKKRQKVEKFIAENNYQAPFEITPDQMQWSQGVRPGLIKASINPDNTTSVHASPELGHEIVKRSILGEEVPGITEDQIREVNRVKGTVENNKPYRRGDYASNYNTVLTPDEQVEYNKYKAALGERGNDSDYDLQGYWLKYGRNEQPKAEGIHFTDEFKKPNHKTFSDQSIYDKEKDKEGNELKGGKWYGDTAYLPPASVLADPTKMRELQEYMQGPAEKGKVQVLTEAPMPKITEDPTAFFSHIRRGSTEDGRKDNETNKQAENAWFNALYQLPADQPLPEDYYNRVRADKNPENIKKYIQMGIKPSDDQLIILHNKERGDSVAGSAWKAAKDIPSELASLAVPLLVGAGTVATDVAGYTGEMINPFVWTGKQPAIYGEKLTSDNKALAAARAGTAEQLAMMGNKMLEGGTDMGDRLLEKKGWRTKEQSEDNAIRRYAFDADYNNYVRRNPSTLARFAENTSLIPAMAADSPGAHAIDAAYKAFGPSVDQILADHPEFNGDRKKAKDYQDHITLNLTNKTVEAWKDYENNHPIDPNVEALAGLIGPGANPFSVGFEAATLSKAAYSSIAKGLREAGKTDAQINAMYAAAAAAKSKKLADDLAKASQVPGWAKVAGKLADVQDKFSTWASAQIEANPKLIKFAPYVGAGGVGATIGAIQNPEHPIEGAITDLLKSEGVVLGWKLPRVASDIGIGKAQSAGGVKGIAESAATRPEASWATKLLLSPEIKGMKVPPKAWDMVGRNLYEWGRAGVDIVPLTIAMNVMNSADADDSAKAFSQGALFVGAGKIMGKFLGTDPYTAQKNREREDRDILKTFQQLSPESQSTINNISDWNHAVENQRQMTSKAQQNFNKVSAEKGATSPEAQAAAVELKSHQDMLREVSSASAATRMEFNRQFKLALNNAHEILNGSLRTGNRNATLEVMTSDQIADRLIQNNNIPPQYRAAVRGLIHSEMAMGRGVQFDAGGGINLPLGADPAIFGNQTKLVFDKFKPTAIINADKISLRQILNGESAIDALNHEVGHLLYRNQEYRDANKDAEAALFGIEFKGVDGKIDKVHPGIFSENDLFDLYGNRYMKDQSPEAQRGLARAAGLWDEKTQTLDRNATVNYMKEEILADVAANTLRKNLIPGKGGMINHIMNWAAVRSKSNMVAHTIHNVLGLGAKDPFDQSWSPALKMKFDPETMQATENAIKAMKNLNGAVSFANEPDSQPLMTRAQMMGDRNLLERYGKDSGLVKTQIQGIVMDSKGNTIGKPIVIANPTAAVGSWIVDKDGKIKQSRGYGQLPDELKGMTLPPGASIHVDNQVLYKADGKTPYLNESKDVKKLVKARATAIRDALSGTDDVGEPGRFDATSSDGLHFSGTFTDKQIQAIKDIPENILPLSIKEKMLAINDLIKNGGGDMMDIDYSTHVDKNGRYVSTAPQIRTIVPLNMHLSKDGNFYVTTVSHDVLLKKLDLWAERMNARLNLWDGDKGKFYDQFVKEYLPNIPKKINDVALDADPAISKKKKDIFNDFMNVVRNDTRHFNEDRTTIPLKRGEKNKQYDNPVRSFRMDAIMDMAPHNGEKLPINYRGLLENWLPAEEESALLRNSEEKERIENATYTNLKTSKVKDGATHLIANPNAPKDDIDREGPAYGFRTSSGRVVDRQEAFKIAQDAGQLIEPKGENQKFHYDRGVLHSGMFELKPTTMPFNGKIVTENRDPALQKAAQALRLATDPQEQKRLAAEYQEMVKDRMPSYDLPAVPKPMSEEVMRDAIQGKTRKDKVGVANQILKQGDMVGSRIDIKASEKGNYVITLHDPRTSMTEGGAGSPVAHESTVHLKNVQFGSNASDALDIAAGRSKGTIATIEGEWQKTSPEEAYKLANDYFNDPEWKQVAMNPIRGSQFTIRSTGKPISSADEVIQIGKFVLVKNPNVAKGADIAERMTTKTGQKFLPADKLDEAHADLERRYKEGDESAMEEAEKIISKKAKDSGFEVGPVWHHGGFDKDIDGIPKTEKGMHFGTKEAATQRAYQKGHDDQIESLKVEQDPETGKWDWTTTDHDSFSRNEEGFNSKKAATDDAYNAIDALYSSDGWSDAEPEDLGTFTKAYLKGKFKKIPDMGSGWGDEIEKAKKEGYDGFIYKNDVEDKGSTSYSIFNPEQAKSADPFTYDNNGKLIPLSQRFDTTKSDIRFMPSAKLDESIKAGELPTEETQNYQGIHFLPSVDKDKGYAEEMNRRMPNGPKTLTYFSGGGLMEVGLQGLINPQYAVEYDPQIAAAYRAAHGDHMLEADITKVDPAQFKDVDYFHASPVCKNFSALKAKSQGGEESELDVRSARAVSRVLKMHKPRFFTLENVKDYKGSDAYENIKRTLKNLGYNFDEAVYNAYDYGAPTDRKRLLLRATTEGELPPVRKVQGKSWYSVVKDLINDLPEAPIRGKTDPEVNYLYDALRKDGIDPMNVPEPILFPGGSLRGVFDYRMSDEPAFTFKATPGNVDRILMPGGRLLRVTARAKARMSGLPDSYKLPNNENLGIKIIGNGIPTDLVRNVFGPMFEKEGGSRFLPIDEEYQKAGTDEEKKAIIEQAAKDAGYTTFGYKAMRGHVPHMSVSTRDMSDPYPATYMAQDKQVAAVFGHANKPVREVATDAQNLFDYRNPKHLAGLEEFLNKMGIDAFNEAHAIAVGDTSSADSRFNYPSIAAIMAFAKEGNWGIMEMPFVKEYIAKQGHEGFYVNEEFQSSSTEPNIAVFDPVRIKSIESETWDDRNLIMPSERFNTRKNDVRYLPDMIKSFKTDVDESVDMTLAIGETTLPKKVPARGWFNLQMNPGVGDRKPIIKIDPKYVIPPPVKDPLKELKGKRVALVQSDRHDALDGRMAGVLYPHLKSSKVVATTKDGRKFSPKWASLGRSMITGNLNRSMATTDGQFLVHMMDWDSHKSNRDFTTRIGNDIDSIKGSLTPEQVAGIHAVLEIGALDAKSTLKAAKEKLVESKAKIEAEPQARNIKTRVKNYEELQAQVDEWEKDWPHYIEFFDKYIELRKTIGKKTGANFDQNFTDLVKEYQNEPWFKSIISKYSSVPFADEAGRLPFTSRGNAMEALHKLPYGPSVMRKLDREADFRGAENTDLVATVQFSKDPDAFGVYTASKRKIPKNASPEYRAILEEYNNSVDYNISLMTDTERDLRDQYLADPNFRTHPSYDWVIVGPPDGNDFIFDRPLDPLEVFPDYPRIGTRNNIVNTMNWAAANRPLIIK